MKIHPVISIAHLEPVPAHEDDPFKRQAPQINLSHPIPERILRTWIRKQAYGTEVAEYMVRFTGLSVDHDPWIRGTQLPLQLIDLFEGLAQEGQ